MLGRLCAAASFAVFYVQIGELLPTVVRAQAMGASSVVAGIGLLTVPYIVALVSRVPEYFFSLISPICRGDPEAKEGRAYFLRNGFVGLVQVFLQISSLSLRINESDSSISGYSQRPNGQPPKKGFIRRENLRTSYVVQKPVLNPYKGVNTAAVFLVPFHANNILLSNL